MFAVVGASYYDLTEEKCKKFVTEILKALNFIHERQIIHLDLKPQNIMMKNKRDEFKIKLIDFGLAKRLEHGRVKLVLWKQSDSWPQRLLSVSTEGMREISQQLRLTFSVLE